MDQIYRQQETTSNLSQSLKDLQFECQMLKEDQQSLSITINKIKIENTKLKKHETQLEETNQRQLLLIEDQQAIVNSYKNKRKIPLLVRKPIYNELKDPLGHAYTEEMLTMRSDHDLFESHHQPSNQSKQKELNLAITLSEIREFKEYMLEQGQPIAIPIENSKNIDELKNQINSWFKTQDLNDKKQFTKAVA